MLILSIVAFIGFFLSLAAHLSTFTNTNLIHDFPLVWGLHAGAMAVCIPMILTEGKATGWKKEGGKQSWQRFLGQLPFLARGVVMAFAIYAFVNFFIGIIYTQKSGGDIVERDGQYVTKQGREVTKEQFDESQRMLLRMFSGHWMIFFLYPACYYLFRRPTRVF
jgi:hypothetical protein